MKALYDYSAIRDAIDQLYGMGYDIIEEEGSLLDSYICLPPQDGMTIYEFDETYLNEWSSAYTVRRSHKISKRLEARLQKIA